MPFHQKHRMSLLPWSSDVPCHRFFAEATPWSLNAYFLSTDEEKYYLFLDAPGTYKGRVMCINGMPNQTTGRKALSDKDQSEYYHSHRTPAQQQYDYIIAGREELCRTADIVADALCLTASGDKKTKEEAPFSPIILKRCLELKIFKEDKFRGIKAKIELLLNKDPYWLNAVGEFTEEEFFDGEVKQPIADKSDPNGPFTSLSGYAQRFHDSLKLGLNAKDVRENSGRGGVQEGVNRQIE
jgi:hypothetical protein